MIAKTVKVLEKGLIALPLEIRNGLGIQKGDELIVIQKARRIIIIKADANPETRKEHIVDVSRLSEKALMDIV